MKRDVRPKSPYWTFYNPREDKYCAFTLHREVYGIWVWMELHSRVEGYPKINLADNLCEMQNKGWELIGRPYEAIY